MRALSAIGLLLFSGCGPGLEFNTSQDMSRDDMLKRANLVFVGVIEKHHIDSWPSLRWTIPEEDPDRANYWKVLRREVRVETVLRGSESRRRIQVYEFAWLAGTSGDWNFTYDGMRALFLVRLENGKYHVVRDWWRSIFPVTSGPHDRLPLDESHSLWERIALMNWWIPRNDAAARIADPHFHYNDPGDALGFWRTVKLQRGLVRHPSPAIRILACRELLLLRDLLQDECWEMLSDTDRSSLANSGYGCCSAGEIAARRRKTRNEGASRLWQHYRDRDSRRLLTAINDRALRSEFCRFWQREYPGDSDNGCPADRPPPATIVTQNGDVPLTGAWPK